MMSTKVTGHSGNLGYMATGQAKRIKDAMAEAGLTQTSVAKSVGVSRVAVTKWCKDDHIDISGANLHKLAKTIKRSPAFILSGTGQSVDFHTLSENVGPGPTIRGDVPVISWAQAGDWQDTHDPYVPGEADEWLPNVARGGPQTYALRVKGESMTPKFSDGEVIFVDPERSPQHKDFVIVRLTESDKTTFKQYVEDETGQGFVRAVNENWDPVTVPAGENAVIKGVVIFSGRFW